MLEELNNLLQNKDQQTLSAIFILVNEFSDLQLQQIAAQIQKPHIKQMILNFLN